MSWVKVDADTIQPPSILSIPRNPGEAAVGGPASVFNLSTSLGGKDIPGFRLATGNAEAIDLVGKTPPSPRFLGTSGSDRAVQRCDDAVCEWECGGRNEPC